MYTNVRSCGPELERMAFLGTGLLFIRRRSDLPLHGRSKES